MPGIISRIPLLNCLDFYGQIKGQGPGTVGVYGGCWRGGMGERI